MAAPKSKTQDQLKRNPVEGAFTPVQSDTVNLTRVGRGLYIGGAGNVKVTGIDGVDYVMVALAVGTWHPCEIIRVWSTGTTGTDILCGNG